MSEVVARCRSCGARIVWIETAAGKKMPLDEKKATVVLDDGTVVTGRVSHFATCPQAGEWRKGKSES